MSLWRSYCCTFLSRVTRFASHTISPEKAIVESPALSDLIRMALLLMEAEDAFSRKQSVTKRAHEAEFKVGVYFTRVDFVFVDQMILD